MTKVRTVAVVVVALASWLAGCMPAQAYFWDGSQLREYCRGMERAIRGSHARNPDEVSAGSMAYGLCVGYVTARLDDIFEGAALLSGAKIPNPCPALRQDITVNDAVAIVRGYLEANPQKLHDSASELVRAALTEAFRCGK